MSIQKKVYIMGGSGVGMIAASILDGMPGIQVAGFINDFVAVGTQIGKYKKISVVAATHDIPGLLKNKNACFFNGFIGMQKQEDAYNSFKSLQIDDQRFINIIAPTALIPHAYCRIGRGVLFAPYAQLSPDCTIANHCRLLANSFVGHDSRLDECVSLATNAVVGANVQVGKGVHVGSNATIREGITVGNFSLIGMGSVVIDNVPPRSIVVGNPARILRQ